MSKFVSDLEHFHQAFGLPAPTLPTPTQPDSLRKLRESLIEEEFREFKEALDEADMASICKEGIDLLYVVVGALVTYGVPIDQCWDEVQRSNMSKLGEDGKPIYRDDGKVMKGPNYSEADIKTVLEHVIDGYEMANY